MEMMGDFFKKNFPDIELPLIKKKITGKGKGSYDYTFTNFYYYSSNDVGLETPIFIEWDDKHFMIDEKWRVDKKLEVMYNFFGEENFENFVKRYFGFDINKHSNKKVKWVFE